MRTDDFSLDDFRIFVAVTETGGFRKAAGVLQVSPSAVSDAVSRLEKSFGAPLLLRTTRSVMLTEAGRTLTTRLSPLLSDLRRTFAEAASTSSRPRGTLKLNVPGAVMVDILPPILDRFTTKYSEVRVEVIVENSFVDAIAAGCDAGIRYGEHLAQDVIAIPIGPRKQQFALAASPEYWKRRGKPSHPSELMEHDTIRLRFRSGALSRWEFERGDEQITVDPPGRITLSTDAVSAALALAVSGTGILLTFRNWLDPHLSNGQLEPALESWWPTFDGPRLYFSSRFTPAHLRAFIDML